MIKLEVTADKITHRGGKAVKGDVVDVDDRSAKYLIANGYAKAWVKADPVKKTHKKKTAKKAFGK